MPTRVDLSVMVLTLLLSGGAVFLVAPLAVGLSYLSARGNRWWSSVLDATVSLPLALPPVAVGIFLLQLLSRQGYLGSMLQYLDVSIVFTWRGVVVALTVMSFPLVYRPARAGFESVDRTFEDLSRSLGRSRLYTFVFVSLPLAWRGVLAGLLLGWARALGEFGCTIVLAGDIAGETRTLSLAIFNRYQMGQDAAAMRLALITALLTALVVGLSAWVGGTGDD